MARIALIADYHNASDLDLVEKAVLGENPDDVWHLGDVIPYENPSAGLTRIQSLTNRGILGNHDLTNYSEICAVSATPKGAENDWASIERLSEEQKSYLSALPLSISVGEILLLHGAPIFGPRREVERLPTVKKGISEDPFKIEKGYSICPEDAFENANALGAQILVVAHNHNPHYWEIERSETGLSIARRQSPDSIYSGSGSETIRFGDNPRKGYVAILPAITAARRGQLPGYGILDTGRGTLEIRVLK